MMRLEILEDVSSVGGGALPGEEMPTCVIAFGKGMISAEKLDHSFRASSPAVVGRIKDGAYRLDLRTIDERMTSLVLKLQGREKIV